MRPRWNPPCICHPIDWSVPFRSLRRGSPSGPVLRGKWAAMAAHFPFNTLFHQASPVRLNAVRRNQNSYQLSAKFLSAISGRDERRHEVLGTRWMDSRQGAPVVGQHGPTVSLPSSRNGWVERAAAFPGIHRCRICEDLLPVRGDDPH